MALISVLPGAFPAQISLILPSASALVFTILLIYQFIILPSKSPLRHLPGPKLTLFTQYYITFLDFLNLRTKTLHEWHRVYGPIVRVGPNEVSFTSPTAIKQIYQDPAVEKYTRFYGLFKHFGVDSSFTSTTRLQHGWRRKGVAASLSWSKILERENTDRLIGSVVGRYINVIEKNSNMVKGLPDRKLVDVYLLNNWFASDVVTGFIFGPHRGSKTLCLDIEGAEGSWWEKPSYHRKVIKEHHESTFRAHTYLYVEFPNFMFLVDRLESIWNSTIKRIQVMLGKINHNSSPGDSVAIHKRVDGWGWKTWETVKNEIAKSREDSNNPYIAEVLAKLVLDSSKLSSSYEDSRLQEGIWTDEVAVSELMVSLHIDPLTFNGALTGTLPRTKCLLGWTPPVSPGFENPSF